MNVTDFLRVINFMLENGIITFEEYDEMYQKAIPYLE